MSWIVQVKDPFDGSWSEKEFEFKQQAIDYGLLFDKFYVYHS